MERYSDQQAVQGFGKVENGGITAAYDWVYGWLRLTQDAAHFYVQRMPSTPRRRKVPF